MGVHRGTEQTEAAADKPADRQPNFYQTPTVPTPSRGGRNRSVFRRTKQKRNRKHDETEKRSRHQKHLVTVYMYTERCYQSGMEDVGFSGSLDEEEWEGGVGGGIGKHERVIVSTLGEKKERRRKVLEVQKK